MAGRKKTGPPPRCQEPLRNGAPCGTVVAEGEDLCAFHLENPPEVREVAVLPPEPVQLPELAPEQVLEEEASPADPVASRRVLPAELRNALASDLGDEYTALVETLQAAMGEATKDAWISCRECGHKAVYTGPDWRTRVDAGAKWMELAIGRKREDPVSAAGRLGEAGVKDPLDMDADERAALMLAMAGNFPSVFVQARALLDDARAAGLNVDKILTGQAAA